MKYIIFYISKITVLTGKYLESLSDAKSATELQPTFLKAIVRGKLYIKAFVITLLF